MNWFLEPFQYEFMQRALLACVLIGFTNGFLGAYVVLRRLSLVADALSHSMLPGLALAAMLLGLNPGGLLLGGMFAAVFVALGGHLIASSSRVKDETAVAALYIIAFALGIALTKYAGSRSVWNTFFSATSSGWPTPIYGRAIPLLFSRFSASSPFSVPCC